ncbi:phage holin family protein [Weissella koreensis]|uniref:phage holin family protein n=1 Tax=Weissella koreensis TaxID=165096 RepID=UPI00026F2D6F|nr:phage holin family protein [Weissella koreensis]EJF34508.1 integral membrane protein [Weissella koreensis KCTC 3621]MCZ9311582.1 phage holin family protein [Weissella koreensis]
MGLKRFSFLQRVIINMIILLALAGLFQQGLYVQSLWSAFMAAVILGVLNVFVRPVLQILSLPLTFFTFGLFSFVVNAFVLWMTSWFVGPGFQFTSFGWAFFISLIMSLVNAILSDFFSR